MGVKSCFKTFPPMWHPFCYVLISLSLYSFLPFSLCFCLALCLTRSMSGSAADQRRTESDFGGRAKPQPADSPEQAVQNISVSQLCISVSISMKLSTGTCIQ